MPNLELYRSLQGVPIRLTMTDGDWLKYNDWKLMEILSAAYPDNFSFHLSDYPNHWAADIDKQLDFHMDQFNNPHLPPKMWNHICPAFPSFTVFDHQFQVSRKVPAHTIIEKASDHQCRVLSRPFIPDGPLIRRESIAVTTSGIYKPHATYELITYNLSSSEMASETYVADEAGKLSFHLTGGGHLMGINPVGDRQVPNLSIAFPGNPTYLYLEADTTLHLDFRIINLSNLPWEHISVRAFSPDPSFNFTIDQTTAQSILPIDFVDFYHQFSFHLGDWDESNYCSSISFELQVDGSAVDTFLQMVHPVPKSPYINENDLLILDGGEASDIAVFQQGPNEIVHRTLTGGEGNGNGVWEPGETALVYIQLDQGMAPGDHHTFHRCYLINAIQNPYVGINTLDYQKKTNQAGATSVATPLSLSSDCPKNQLLDLWFKVESLYNDESDTTSNATIYAHQYDYRKAKLVVNSEK